MEQMVIPALRTEAQTDKFSEAAFTCLAAKPRSNWTLTVDALKQRMVKEGFTFDEERARRFLTVLSNLGFGKLQKLDGKVISLTEIRTTLPSIGKAALGEAVDLEKFRIRRRYTKLADVPKVAKASAPVPQAPTTVFMPRPRTVVGKAALEASKPVARAAKPVVKPAPAVAKPRSTVGLVVALGGKTIRLPVDDLSSEEVALILDRFREPKRA